MTNRNGMTDSKEHKWVQLTFTNEHPYYERIIELQNKGKAMGMRDMKEELFQAECNLIALGPDDNDLTIQEIGELCDDARNTVRRVRKFLTLMLGDAPDNLLADCWFMPRG